MAPLLTPGGVSGNLLRPSGFNPYVWPLLSGAWRTEAGIIVTGSGISNWANQAVTGSGYDWVQGTDNQRPQLISNVINGYPVIRGDGINDNLQLREPA